MWNGRACACPSDRPAWVEGTCGYCPGDSRWNGERCACPDLNDVVSSDGRCERCPSSRTRDGNSCRCPAGWVPEGDAVCSATIDGFVRLPHRASVSLRMTLEPGHERRVHTNESEYSGSRSTILRVMLGCRAWDQCDPMGRFQIEFVRDGLFADPGRPSSWSQVAAGRLEHACVVTRLQLQDQSRYGYDSYGSVLVGLWMPDAVYQMPILNYDDTSHAPARFVRLLRATGLAMRPRTIGSPWGSSQMILDGHGMQEVVCE